MGSQDPRQALGRYLRALREERWPNMKVHQAQLAQALGGDGRPLSVPLISSWESLTRPRIPPLPRLEAYATFFATERSMAETPPRMLSLDELTEPERQARDKLLRELMSLRRDALHAVGVPRPGEESEALSHGPWRFDDGKSVTIVCAQLPSQLVAKIPYTDPDDPDYIDLYRFSDLDALFELYGHLRAANPTSQINLRTAQNLQPDDYTTHLVSLGGVDWNGATSSLLDLLQFPLKQVSDWESPDGVYFEVENDGRTTQHRPRLEEAQGKRILREDVALFARAVNPYNRLRTVSICNGTHASGCYGAVRALTDARFRDRNASYIKDRFADSESFCLLSRVNVEAGGAVTPDWTVPQSRLFEWSSSQRHRSSGPGDRPVHSVTDT